MKIIVGNDHGGYALKKIIVNYLNEKKIDVTDAGSHSDESVDYPAIALNVAQKVAGGEFTRGILVCGSGVGMSIVANKVQGIRAALCMTPDQAELCIRHNNANIITFAGRITGVDTIREMIDRWLNAEFEGGRHERRIKQIHELTGV